MLPIGDTVRIPTIAETLRIKAFLIVRRNQVRDFLDVAALSAEMGIGAAAVVMRIDEFYADTTKEGRPVQTQLLRQLGDPRPRDLTAISDFSRYKGLRAPWESWDAVRQQCRRLAAQVLAQSETGDGER